MKPGLSLFPAAVSSAAVHTQGAMRGFHAEFKDLDQYIRVITDRIWEGRRLGDIRTYYSDPCVVETAMSVSTSVEDVIQGTEATLAMFPDRRLLAEDVIVSGDAAGGYLSSHRIISPMTHAGDGAFGPATGRKICARTVADCVCKDNRIVHEWLVRDHAAIALQIGTTPRALAQTWLNQRGGWHKPVAGPAPAGYRSAVSTEPLARHYAGAIEAFANRHDAPDTLYDEAAHHIGPGQTSRYGRKAIGAFWRSLFGSLHTHSFALEHLAWQQGGDRPGRVALRFRAKTVHTAIDTSLECYGKSSNKEVEVLAIVHAEFCNGRVLREWVLIDDVALWMQVLTPGEPGQVSAQRLKKTPVNP